MSLIVHVSSFLDIDLGLGESVYFLHIAIFIVCIPAFMTGNIMAKDVPKNEFWKASLRGCPGWMKIFAYIQFTYSFINFFLVFILQTSGEIPEPTDKLNPLNLRVFSGVWMAFYAMGWATLFSAIRILPVLGKVRKCLSGHPASETETICQVCGSPIITQKDEEIDPNL